MIWALAVAGLVVGALLPQVIARIPDRELAVEHAPGHDSSGEPPVTPYRELAAAPRLPLLLAVATAVTWVVLGLAVGVEDGIGSTVAGVAELAAYLVVGALGVAMGYVDLREFRLPDWLTLPSFVAAAVLLAVAAAADGAWGPYGRAWLAAAVSVAFYLLLALIRPGDLGLGDVKLAGVLGLLLGWAGWSAVVLGIFLGFAVGGIVGAGMLLAGRAGRRSNLPFGPPMLVGALLALLWGQLIADAYTGL